MVDRIRKALLKMSAGDRDQILEILSQVEKGSFEGLDIKRLKGFGEAFRIRKGSWRVIIGRSLDGTTRVLSIERRSESTYRNL